MKLRDSLVYCLADQANFDLPHRLEDGSTRFRLADSTVPLGWTRAEGGIFIHLTPSGGLSREQGWKVHVSSVASTAERVLELVADWCFAQGVAFKFVRSNQLARAINSKHWPRSESGKFITVYPQEDELAISTIQHLSSALAGFEGPHVLTDVRCGKAPVFTRYGAFKAMSTQLATGEFVPAIRTPSGALIEDRRDPVFRMPDFVSMPEGIHHLVSTPEKSLDEFDYRFISSILFSNAGGLYFGECKATGERVVVREARPHAGLDANNDDAVFRLRAERQILTNLDGHPALPRLLDYRKLWENEFLVREFVALPTMLDEITRRYPFVHPVPDRSEVDAYQAWASWVLDRIDTELRDIHRRGYAIGDLHPDNILIGEDGRIVFIDLECATPIEASFVYRMGAPGLHSLTASTPIQADLHALDRLRLMTFLPIAPVIGLDRTKASTLRAIVRCEFGQSALSSGDDDLGDDCERFDAAAEMFTGQAEDWPKLKLALVEGILQRATPDRTEMLYPGDPKQFSQGTGSLAYGAAGTILALSSAGLPVPLDHRDWLFRSAMSEKGQSGRGLFTGPHGAAFALAHAKDDRAPIVLNHALKLPAPDSVNLFGGAAGVILNTLYFAERLHSSQLFDLAFEGARSLAAHVSKADSEGAAAGLFEGQSGPALALIETFERTGDLWFLDAAEVCLRRDVAKGAFHPDGTFHLRVGSRNLPYLDGGSIGVGFVLLKFLAHRPDTEFEAVVNAVLLGCRAPFVFQPGLFQGRLGLIAFAVACSRAGRPSGMLDVPAQVRRLGWHAVITNNTLAIPGTGLLRASTDLATGAAGALLVLRCVFEKGGLLFPFL